MPERLALCDLGAPGWGQPWFPHSAVLLYSLLWCGDVCDVGLVSLFSVSPPYPIWVDTMLSSLFYLTLLNWPADHSPSLLVFFGLLFAFVSLVVLCWCFPCFLVWFWDCDGSLDYVSVLASSTFEAFFNSLRQCNN